VIQKNVLAASSSVNIKPVRQQAVSCRLLRRRPHLPHHFPEQCNGCSHSYENLTVHQIVIWIYIMILNGIVFTVYCGYAGPVKHKENKNSVSGLVLQIILHMLKEHMRSWNESNSIVLSEIIGWHHRSLCVEFAEPTWSDVAAVWKLP
jgi:hypothetical protein